jgi:hypothetical protein
MAENSDFQTRWEVAVLVAFQITHILSNTQGNVLGAVSFSIALEIALVTRNKFWCVSPKIAPYNVN